MGLFEKEGGITKRDFLRAGALVVGGAMIPSALTGATELAEGIASASSSTPKSIVTTPSNPKDRLNRRNFLGLPIKFGLEVGSKEFHSPGGEIFDNWDANEILKRHGLSVASFFIPKREEMDRIGEATKNGKGMADKGALNIFCPSVMEYTEQAVAAAKKVTDGSPKRIEITANLLQMFNQIESGGNYLVSAANADSIDYGLLQINSNNVYSGIAGKIYDPLVNMTRGAELLQSSYLQYASWMFPNLPPYHPIVLATACICYNSGSGNARFGKTLLSGVNSFEGFKSLDNTQKQFGFNLQPGTKMYVMYSLAYSTTSLVASELLDKGYSESQVTEILSKGDLAARFYALEKAWAQSSKTYLEYVLLCEELGKYYPGIDYDAKGKPVISPARGKIIKDFYEEFFVLEKRKDPKILEIYKYAASPATRKYISSGRGGFMNIKINDKLVNQISAKWKDHKASA